ncbi:hypothetical protein PVAG01_07350 [Phlyctema vagabunda]|uniref:Uncharacterized protein n=1 Tax=Phlyctema vagabunda TaxID=108571 RepID=A0ABR4PC85_9HELO
MQIPTVDEEPQGHPPHPHVSEDLETWTCAACHKSISASRPPVLNTDNCSCAELGGLVDGLVVADKSEKTTTTTTTTTHDARTYAGVIYEHGAPEQDKLLTYHVAPSSSDNSVQGPEGPERHDPNDVPQRPTAFLPLGPDAGLGEKRHHQTASFFERMPVTLQRFLAHRDPAERVFFYSDAPGDDDGDADFLKQDPFLSSSSSIRAHKGSYETKRSQQSSSGDDSAVYKRFPLTWGPDPTTGMGEWIGQDDGGEDGDDLCAWMEETRFEDDI